MRSLVTYVLAGSLAVLSGCGGEKVPSTPLETFRTYTKAIKQKDTTAMKLLLSSETLKMHEQQAKSQGTTVDEIVKRESLFSETQNRVEYRNEKIDGQTATLEVKNSLGDWEVVPFVYEGDQWKIDKKGAADRMMREIEEATRSAEEEMNRDRVAPTDLQPPSDVPSNTSKETIPEQ